MYGAALAVNSVIDGAGGICDLLGSGTTPSPAEEEEVVEEEEEEEEEEETLAADESAPTAAPTVEPTVDLAIDDELHDGCSEVDDDSVVSPDTCNTTDTAFCSWVESDRSVCVSCGGERARPRVPPRAQIQPAAPAPPHTPRLTPPTPTWQRRVPAAGNSGRELQLRRLVRAVRGERGGQDGRGVRCVRK